MMRKRFTLAMAMFAFAIAAQAQETQKISTSKVLTEAEARPRVPLKEKNSRFGMELQQYLGTKRGNTLSKKAGGDAVKEGQIVNVLVMLMPSAGVTAEALESAGCKVNWSMKSQAFVTAPIEKLDEIAKINGVLSINLPEEHQIYNNVAREMTGVATLADPVSAAAAGLPQAYDGSGVIVGVVDTGIDFAHPAFRNADGTTRIKRGFTYRRTDTIMPDEPESNWKNTYTDPEEILNVTPVTIQTHGSHVMGTAAGSNTGNNLQGMAPKADLVPADLINLSNNYLVSALKSICEYAEEVGKPVVTNYSIGSPGTFRDGCDATSQALIELTENGTKPGVIFSLGAGNSGEIENYVHHKFTSDDEKVYVMLDIPSEIKEYDSETPGEKIRVHKVNEQEFLVGCTNNDEDNAEEMLIAYSLDGKRILDASEKIGVAKIYKAIEGDEIVYYFTDAEDRDFVGMMNITLGALRSVLKNEYHYSYATHYCVDGVTKKKQMWFRTMKEMDIALYEDVRLGGCFSFPAGTELTVINLVNKSGGKFIKPEGFDYLHLGTSDGCINEDACNMANITVGAYNERNKFTNYFGEESIFSRFEIGEVSSFTSYGYTNDENHLPKPDVLAPGLFILSAVNGNYAPYFSTYGTLLPKDKMETSKFLEQKIEFGGKDYWYEYMAGTSMAAPVVTGIIALWLQADPTLSVRDIRNVIAHSSVPYKGSNTVQSSLFGKIDALAGLKYIVNEVTGIDNITYPQTTDATDNRIFTLDGREVKGAPSAGIYVTRGKKIVYRK